MAKTKHRIELPPKLIPVFAGEARYRGAYGGRGSAKTRSFAKMAAVRGLMFAMAGVTGIVLCGREFMNSLDESSMAEVKAAIASDPWLSANYDIGEKYIRTKCGRVAFRFAGLRHNLASIKSKARILILWIDEAEPVSEDAWRVIVPTVREQGSEIWVTWNPESRESATHIRFRVNPPPNSKIVEINWVDNPWFPDVLNQERLSDERDRPGTYAHVWDGDFKAYSDDAIFRLEWFQTYDEWTDFRYRKIFVDTAQKTKQHNDYSVFQCWGKTLNGRAFLLDQTRGRFEAPELLDVARAFWKKHAQDNGPKYGQLRSMAIEDKVSGTGLIQQLRGEGVPVEGIPRSKDKRERGLDVAPLIASGFVFLPVEAPWLQSFKDEVATFDGLGKAHDDQVDPMIDAVSEILGSGSVNIEDVL